MSRPRPGTERGAVSLVTAVVAGVALVLAVGASDVARVLVASARAQTAADAAALAAAQELALPSGQDPAAVAADYAGRNGAAMVDCSCPLGASEATVKVMVEVGALLLVGGDRAASARARAVVDLSSGPPAT